MKRKLLFAVGLIVTATAVGNTTNDVIESIGNDIESGASSYDIPATNLPSGIYQLTLIEDGSVTGTMKFTK